MLRFDRRSGPFPFAHDLMNALRLCVLLLNLPFQTVSYHRGWPYDGRCVDDDGHEQRDLRPHSTTHHADP